MNGSCDYFLPGPGFAKQQDGDSRRRRLFGHGQLTTHLLVGRDGRFELIIDLLPKRGDMALQGDGVQGLLDHDS
ncbi:MAG: hypothetical protein HC794_01195 [Nitrospiraceae bacterium]|nr:hypothetical protein [Nitrospiraceae bacterium]